MIYKAMNPRTDKIVRRTTMVATAVASYFLLTADYGPQPNAVEPVSHYFFLFLFVLVLFLSFLDKKCLILS
jgi:hypothetical protein